MIYGLLKMIFFSHKYNLIDLEIFQRWKHFLTYSLLKKTILEMVSIVLVTSVVLSVTQTLYNQVIPYEMSNQLSHNGLPWLKQYLPNNYQPAVASRTRKNQFGLHLRYFYNMILRGCAISNTKRNTKNEILKKNDDDTVNLLWTSMVTKDAQEQAVDATPIF